MRDHGLLIENISALYDNRTTNETKLPEKVLQLLFTGVTGFRFPVAHYPTNGMTSRELRLIIDAIITALWKHNFQVTQTSAVIIVVFPPTYDIYSNLLTGDIRDDGWGRSQQDYCKRHSAHVWMLFST
jgi:hypothetical protein